MNILLYFFFTSISVVFQFCFMEYIQRQIDAPKQITDLNLTSQRKLFSEILKDYKNKPHALFYRTNVPKSAQIKLDKQTSPLPIKNETSTEIAIDIEIPQTSAVYDVLLDEESTITTEIPFTSEEPFSATEFENVTDLSIFSTSNQTTVKPTAELPKKKTYAEDCYCNLLYQVCDINCCCDRDCSENDAKLFKCTEKGTSLQQDDIFCSVLDEKSPMLSKVDHLFCIVRTNLPDKRNTNYKKYNTDEAKKVTDRNLKWHEQSKMTNPIIFSPKSYTDGDPIWLLKNGSVTYIDLPSSQINSYCDNRSPIYFLKDQQWKCNVVIKDLEMFHIIKSIQDTSVVSVTDKLKDNLSLNCTTLYCTNWTIIVCNETVCTNYSKEQHEPVCTDTILCTNLALRVEYLFHYHEAKITNATVYFHTHSVSPRVPLFTQDISVKFIIGLQDAIKKPLQLSGNPGYLMGLPVIASFQKNNYSSNFFEFAAQSNNMLIYPENRNGVCVLSNTTSTMVYFGTNKRSKCRYVHELRIDLNRKDACEHIQNNVTKMLGIDGKVFISPLGNPRELMDEDWIELKEDSHVLPLYGEYYKESNVLRCYNVISKVSFVFGFADVSDIAAKQKIKILSATAHVATHNVTFHDEKPSYAVTIETIFVDVTKPPVYEYAASPQLNIHLPRDFFFPFPSNKCCANFTYNIMMLSICLVIAFISK